MTLALRVTSRVEAGQIHPVERGSVLSENHDRVELAERRGPPHRLRTSSTNETTLRRRAELEDVRGEGSLIMSVSLASTPRARADLIFNPRGHPSVSLRSAPLSEDGCGA